MSSTDADAQKVHRLIGSLARILAGNPAPVQGAVLADLLAIWLAGHIAESGDAAETARLREEMLDYHLRAVRALVPINAERIHGSGRP